MYCLCPEQPALTLGFLCCVEGSRLYVTDQYSGLRMCCHVLTCWRARWFSESLSSSLTCTAVCGFSSQICGARPWLTAVPAGPRARSALHSQASARGGGSTGVDVAWAPLMPVLPLPIVLILIPQRMVSAAFHLCLYSRHIFFNGPSIHLFYPYL